MKVLLATPIQRTYVVMPPFGLGYLATVARKAGHEPHILHSVLEGFDFAKFREFVAEGGFDVVGMHMNSLDLHSVKRHFGIIKETSPETVTVVGGAHSSGDPAGTMRSLKSADFAFQGEAEIGFGKLLDALKKSRGKMPGPRALRQIPGLVWRNGEKVEANKPGFVEDLDSLGFPAWDLIDPRRYPEAPHGAFAKNFPTAPIIITRGCPFQCTFCAGKNVTGPRVRKRSIRNVVDEIKFLKKNYGVREIMIEDENFTLHRNLVVQFCQVLIKQKIGITWSLPSGVRLDTLDRELVQLMEKSGCYSIAVGIEFGSQRILDLTKKQLTIEKIREKMALFRNSGIKVTGFFMMGYPGETEEEINSTINLALELPLQRAQFNNFMPLPGSEIYNKLQEQHRLGNIDFDRFFVHDVAFVPDSLTKEKLKNLQRKAYLRFYLRPRVVFGLLREIKSPKHLYLLFGRFVDAMKG